MLVNNSTNININKTNNHLSPWLIEHKKRPWHMHGGNPSHSLGQAQKYGGLNLLIRSQPSHLISIVMWCTQHVNHVINRLICFVDINIGGIVDQHCLNFVFVMITCHTLTSQSVIHCSFSEGVSFNLLISSSILRNPKSFSGSSGSLVGAFWRNSSNLVTWKKHVIFQISFS